MTLKRLLKAFVPIRTSPSRRLDAVSIARRYGRGNVAIQCGRIMTPAEYKEQKRRVLAYEF